MYRELALLGGSRVAVDGTYMKADANRSSFHTKATVERDLKRLDAKIAAYHRQLDVVDAQSQGRAGVAEDPERAVKIEALVDIQHNKKALRAPWKGAFSWWDAKPTQQLSFSVGSSRSGTWRVRHGLKHSGDKGLR